MEFKRRKWGWYLTLLDRFRFKVKILSFRPGLAMSMQRHMCRSELWLILKGRGTMFVSTHGEDAFPGDFFTVESGQWHQYTAETPTRVLEIQYGSKCVEEDIERA